MQYDDIIRIQNSIDLKYIKEASKTINNAEIQSRINELRKAIEPLCNMKIWETQSVSKQLSNMIKMSSSNICQKLIPSCVTSEWSFLYNSNMVIPRKKVEKKIPQSKIRLLTSQVSKNLIEQRGI